MLELLPRRAFFQFELDVAYVERVPTIDADMRKWSPRYLLPPLTTIEDAPEFAKVYWAWHESGLLTAFDVNGGPPTCSTSEWWKLDGLRVCLNTRDTPDIKRATRYCHFFYLLPTGAGASRKQPAVGLHRMSRAKEHPPNTDCAQIRFASRVHREGYAMEAFFPASVLHGWDPLEQPRVGLFYKVKRVNRTSQHLTVSDELGWNVDPSTWATGVLTRGGSG